MGKSLQGKENKCRHYWIIDSIDIGVCKLCGAKRDFGKLQGRSSYFYEKALLGGMRGKDL